jgi:TfoX/Sxy family transcriptional regulator of competence genes
MATDKDFVACIAEQAQLGSALVFKRMFGEYGVYLDGNVVGFVCDNSLFVKATAATTTVITALPQRPPYPGAKPYAVADELLDDSEALKALLQATAAALPLPKPKAAGKRGL